VNWRVAAVGAGGIRTITVELALVIEVTFTTGGVTDSTDDDEVSPFCQVANQAFLDRAAIGFRHANDLPIPKTAARETYRHDRWPMVAAGAANP